MDFKHNLSLKSDNDVDTVVEWESVKISIENIILSSRGKKKFNYNFGCSLDTFINKPVSNLTISQLSTIIRFNLENYEKRVEIISISINYSNLTYYITIKVKYNNTTQNLSLEV